MNSFTPIPPHEKRTVKTAIDVGCDRVGDMLGAGVIQLILISLRIACLRPCFS